MNVDQANLKTSYLLPTFLQYFISFKQVVTSSMCLGFSRFEFINGSRLEPIGPGDFLVSGTQFRYRVED